MEDLPSAYRAQWETRSSETDVPDVFAFLDSHDTPADGEALDVLSVDLALRSTFVGAVPVGWYRRAEERVGMDGVRALLAAEGRLLDESGDPGETVTVVGSSGPVGDSSRPSSEGEPIRQWGDYDLIRELGRGGMGVVYEAWHRSLNRTVALKMIKSGELAERDEIDRFLGEARAAARLDHSGIVPVYEVGEVEERPYFSMAYVPGRSLADVVRDGPMEPNRAAELLREIAEAVTYAHERGIVHRDLKPSNVLLDEFGQPRVLDFGLAKLLDDGPGLTATGDVLGTPAYMPPEQAEGRTADVGPRSDVYSLGAVLYQVLTGRPPFQAATLAATLQQVLDVEPAPPRQVNPAVPVELEAICLTCLRKNPAERYESAAAFADDLRRFLEGESIRARAEGVWSRATRQMLRETRHTEMLARWSRVWKCHAVITFLILAVANGMLVGGVQSAWSYLGLAFGGMAAMGLAVWQFRFRDGEPLSPVERQIGPIWNMFAAIAAVTALLGIPLGLTVQQVVPVILLECGLCMGCMASILGGSFYPLAGTCVLVAVVATYVPAIGPIVAGVCFAVGLWIPAARYAERKDD